VRIGVRFVLLGFAAGLLLLPSPAALGDSGTAQLVVPSSSSDCLGFSVEGLDGTVTGCTPRPDGVSFINTEYEAAADGSVVFMANDNTDPSSGDQGSIWLVKPDGSSVHLDDSTWDFAPTVSYDGSKVVFARFDPTTWSSDIYSVDSDGSDLQLVVSGDGTNYLTSPSISPDGSTIAYWCGPADYAASAGLGCGPLTDGSYRGWGVMRVNVDGTDPRMISIGAGAADEVAGSQGVSWSPDGQSLAMTGDSASGSRDVYVYRADGSDLFNNLDPTRQITHETDPYGAGFAQFSPAGSQLLYMKWVDDGGNQGNFTYMIGVDGTNEHEVPVNYGEFIPTATPVPPPPLVDKTHITVPSVETLDVGAATKKLDAVNLTVGTVSYEYSSTVGDNRVVSQDPSAGAVAHRTQKVGPPVNLMVSLGPPPTPSGPPPTKIVCVVPKMRGKSLKATKRATTAAHCQVGTIKRAFSRTVKKGRVLSERPGGGKTLPDAAKVALTISKGKRASRR
jgi:PASTA domain/WD40-like Beta Propeller Repeat